MTPVETVIVTRTILGLYQTTENICLNYKMSIYLPTSKMFYRHSIPDGKLRIGIDEESEYIIDCCVKNGAVDIRSQEISHAFILAAQNGQLDIMKLLLNHFACDPNYECGLPIQNVARYGRLDVVEFLLTVGRVDPGVYENYPIRAAAQFGHCDVVRLLINDERVNPAACNNYAIRLAADNGRYDVVKLLMSDERVNPADCGSISALQNAARNGHCDVVKLLLTDKRVDPAFANNKALLNATRNGHFDTVKILMEDERSNPSLNHSILATAARNGHIDIVRFLMTDKRVNPAALCNVALRRAFGFFHWDVVKLLLSSDFRVWECDIERMLKRYTYPGCMYPDEASRRNIIDLKVYMIFLDSKCVLRTSFTVDILNVLVSNRFDICKDIGVKISVLAFGSELIVVGNRITLDDMERMLIKVIAIALK